MTPGAGEGVAPGDAGRQTLRLARRVADLAPAPRGPADPGPGAFVPPRLIGEVRAALLAGETHYTSRPGMPALRVRVADVLAQLGGPRYDPAASIVITAGEREGLFVTLLGLRLAPGEVAIAAPGPGRYDSLFRLMQLSPVPLVPGDPQPGIRLIYREAEAGRDLHATACAASAARGLPNVLNVGCPVGGARAGSLPPISQDRTILVGSLDDLAGSVAFGAGFVASPAPLMAHIRTWKQAYSICTAAPCQRAALAAFDLSREEAR